MLIVFIFLQNIAKLSNNRQVQDLSVCCECGCCDRFCKYLVRNAYIIVALEGTPLVKSGKRAFFLLKRHIVLTWIMSGVIRSVMFTAELLVAIISAFTAFIFSGVSMIIEAVPTETSELFFVGNQGS
jgi:solute carrier family 44 (choline transporter-like protein), member 2/4/5